MCRALRASLTSKIIKSKAIIWLLAKMSIGRQRKKDIGPHWPDTIHH